MTIPASDLEQITSLTIAHYQRNAEQFRDGTRDHDVSQNIAALLRHLPGKPPFTILDFGCGPGRDLQTFTQLGHTAIGVDGAASFAAMARAASGCEVWQQDFLRLNLPPGCFDGVFANASLFHIPSQELPRVLRELAACLRSDGVLFSSNPRGDNEEGWAQGRYGVYLDLAGWRVVMQEAGFIELEYFYRPTGAPFAQQRWLATAWRKAHVHPKGCK